MTIETLPCAICDEPVSLDQPYVKMQAVYRDGGSPPEEYIAHPPCMDELREAIP